VRGVQGYRWVADQGPVCLRRGGVHRLEWKAACHPFVESRGSRSICSRAPGGQHDNSGHRCGHDEACHRPSRPSPASLPGMVPPLQALRAGGVVITCRWQAANVVMVTGGPRRQRMAIVWQTDGRGPRGRRCRVATARFGWLYSAFPGPSQFGLVNLPFGTAAPASLVDFARLVRQTDLTTDRRNRPLACRVCSRSRERKCGIVS
jgi:hypothetical protein